ncbi:hypothetical protein MBRU_12385 [Mycolicibacterium brumae DSM 44177]|nr:hypothetical protein MBRU_12385 [Mycolicibacterium brumae DSM 44177]
MAAGEVDRVIVGRVDLIGRRGVRQQRHLLIIGFPRLAVLSKFGNFSERGSSGDSPPCGLMMVCS